MIIQGSSIMQKVKKSYKITRFLNARFIDGQQVEQVNTFQIICYVTSDKNLASFDELKKSINTIIDNYTGQSLNEMQQFKDKEFSLELMAEYLTRDIQRQLSDGGYNLKKAEIAESPVRSYVFEF